MGDKNDTDRGKDAPYDYTVCPVADFNEIRILELRGGSSEDIECKLVARSKGVKVTNWDSFLRSRLRSSVISLGGRKPLKVNLYFQ